MLHCFQDQHLQIPLSICCWSRDGDLDKRIGCPFQPNHIVPVFVISKSKKAKLAPKVKVQSKLKFETVPKPPSFPDNIDVQEKLKQEVNIEETSKDTDKCDKKYSNSSTIKISENQNKFFDDIASFYNIVDQLSADDKFEIMKNIWKPPPEFDFPVQPQGNNRKRKFVHKWLSEHPWLVYSKSLDGAFCLPCVLFGRRIGLNCSKLSRLFKTPFTTWSTATKIFVEHERSSEIHHTSVATMNEFKRVMEGKIKPVSLILDNALQARINGNRAKLRPIIKTVVFCGRQNIALRGHRDDADHLDNENPGNFQALLDFRIDSGDTILKEHFATAKRNATYRSKTHPKMK